MAGSLMVLSALGCTRSNGAYEDGPGEAGGDASTGARPVTRPVPTSGAAPTASTTRGPAATTGCDAPTFFPDVDGDGYGDPEGPPACGPQPGYVDNDEDCDDADAGINVDLGCEPIDGLRGWFRFEEELLQDHSGHDNHAALGVDGGPLMIPEGAVGQAAYFDDPAQMLVLDDLVDDVTGPRGAPPPEGTLEAWLRLDELPVCPNAEGCFAIAVYLGNSGSGFGGDAEAHLHAVRQQGSWSWQGWIGAAYPSVCQVPAAGELRLTPVVAGAWTHVAMSWREGGSCSLYLNGEPVADGEFPDSSPVPGLWFDGRIGQAVDLGATRSFLGSIDEVMVWIEERDPSQIRDDCGPACRSR